MNTANWYVFSWPHAGVIKVKEKRIWTRADFSPENCLFLCQPGQNLQFHSLSLQTLKQKVICQHKHTQTWRRVFNSHKVHLNCVVLTVNASWNTSDRQQRKWNSKLLCLFLCVCFSIGMLSWAAQIHTIITMLPWQLLSAAVSHDFLWNLVQVAGLQRLHRPHKTGKTDLGKVIRINNA